MFIGLSTAKKGLKKEKKNRSLPYQLKRFSKQWHKRLSYPVMVGCRKRHGHSCHCLEEQEAGNRECVRESNTQEYLKPGDAMLSVLIEEATHTSGLQQSSIKQTIHTRMWWTNTRTPLWTHNVNDINRGVRMAISNSTPVQEHCASRKAWTCSQRWPSRTITDVPSFFPMGLD